MAGSIQAPFSSQEISSKNILVVELTLGNHTLIYEFNAFESIATYSFDISMISNPLRLIQVDGLPIINVLGPLAVHPDWFLAAWSVDNQGFLLPNRSAAIATVRELRDYEYYLASSPMEYFVFRSYLQALSMVNYNYEEYESPKAARQARASGRTGKWLNSYRQVYIWTYGIYSRTAKLGVVVVSVGCLVVVAQVVLSVLKPPHQRSITELLASALAHDYQGELSKSRMEEKDVGKFRFRWGLIPGMVHSSSHQSVEGMEELKYHLRAMMRGSKKRGEARLGRARAIQMTE